MRACVFVCVCTCMRVCVCVCVLCVCVCGGGEKRSTRCKDGPTLHRPPNDRPYHESTTDHTPTPARGLPATPPSQAALREQRWWRRGSVRHSSSLPLSPGLHTAQTDAWEGGGGEGRRRGGEGEGEGKRNRRGEGGGGEYLSHDNTYLLRLYILYLNSSIHTELNTNSEELRTPLMNDETSESSAF